MDSDADLSGAANVLETIRARGIITGFIILGVTWFLVRAVGAVVERAGDRFVHRRLLINQAGTLLRFLLYIGGISGAVGASITLSQEVVIALAGTAALTVGFALKDLAASIMAGLTIIVDRPFQVGDRVRFEDNEGEITSIGLRSVRILTSDNVLVTIPNNKFLTESVVSLNHGELDMLIATEFFIAPDQDIALAKRVVEECVTSNRYVYLGKPWNVAVAMVMFEFGPAVRLRATAHVIDVKYDDNYSTDVTERVLQAFQDKGIALPVAPGRDRLTPRPA